MADRQHAQHDDGRPDLVAAAVAEAHARDWARVVSAAARTAAGNLGLAEDAAQDAYVQALETWGSRGVPRNPAAWLTRTAQRKVLDGLRRETTLSRKLPLVGASMPPESAADQPTENLSMQIDDRLRLVFTCCHPALAMDSRVALTLRLVGGLTTAEIASAFLVKESAMAARLTRAKHKVSAAAIPYRVPPDSELPDRLDGVLAVIHLISTAGHTAPAGPGLQRRDLSEQALDLASMLAVLVPDEPEALGLLALLQLTHSRRHARQTASGAIVLLVDQDRARWDRDMMASGLRLAAVAQRRLGPTRAPRTYQIQAEIAAVHARAATFAATDWSRIVLLYDQLRQVWPSPVVELNRAVAVSYLEGPEAGLTALRAVADDPRLARYHYLPAARADMLVRTGRALEARSAYEDALALVGNEPERRFLQARIAQL